MLVLQPVTYIIQLLISIKNLPIVIFFFLFLSSLVTPKTPIIIIVPLYSRSRRREGREEREGGLRRDREGGLRGGRERGLRGGRARGRRRLVPGSGPRESPLRDPRGREPVSGGGGGVIKGPGPKPARKGEPRRHLKKIFFI